MVLPVGPARFYGSGLPRPFIYSDVKFNSERVDPPLGVTTPFMTWANDAHWSMGGICLKRKRMQGRIEGSIKKLRAEEERKIKIKNRDEERGKRLRNTKLMKIPLQRAIQLQLALKTRAFPSLNVRAFQAPGLLLRPVQSIHRQMVVPQSVGFLSASCPTWKGKVICPWSRRSQRISRARSHRPGFESA